MHDLHATTIALAIGGDDMGAAWLIARRSPNLTRSQVANAAKNEGMRDTTGRRRLTEGETGDDYRARTDRREIDRRSNLAQSEPSDAVLSLAADCAELLGELGEALANGFTQAEAGELSGCSVKTVERRVAVLRQIKITRIAEQLHWRDWR